MSVTRIEWADGWEQALRAELGHGLTEYFDGGLGPAMVADMQRFVPVDTARLLNCLDHAVVDGDNGLPELQAGAFTDAEGEVEYAAPVELGFRGPENVRAHTRNGRPVRAHVRQANTPEQPYMRPALYQERDI